MGKTSGPILWHHFSVATPSQTLSVGEHAQEGLSTTVPMLFITFEGSRPLAGSTRHSLIDIDEVQIGRGEQRQVRRFVEGSKRVLKLTLPDSLMSTRHAMFRLSQGSVQVMDLSSKNGTLISGQKVESQTLVSGDIVELGCTFFSYIESHNCDLREVLKRDIEWKKGIPGIESLLPDLRAQARNIEKIANSKASVIVHGESGTGKELVARAIHTLSNRPGPFIAVNCAAIPDTLLESELFGHKRGAFSGAIADKKGLIEAASGGTLFLDEIAELSPKGQASLLRVLEQRELLPVGATRTVPLDLRVVAATHSDLLQEVAQSRFREDLYARLSTFVARVPPLRERIPEIGSIIASLLERQRAPLSKLCFAPNAARALLHYNWPRNIRELEKCLDSASVLSDRARIDLGHLSELIQAAPSQTESVATSVPKSDDAKLRIQLLALLQEHRGNVTQVGNVMGKKRQQIQKWCKRLDIDPKQFR